MKTAMEELIELLKELQIDARNSLATEFQIAMTFAIGRAETKLEKEKEQIIEAHADGAEDLNFNGEITERGLKNAEYYYNQTYNQNK